MIVHIPVRWRAAVAGCVLAAPPAMLCQPSREGVHLASEALAGAKKDLEAIQSARDASLMPKEGLPRFEGAEIAAPAPRVRIGTKPSTPSPEAKGANWLIDAMKKQKARDGRGRPSRSHERRATVSSEGQESNADEQEGGGSPQYADERKRGESTPLVENPLTRYLSDWMTPQDYALLKPGLSEAFDHGIDAGNSARFTVPGLGTALSNPEDVAFGGESISSKAVTPVVPRENLYLEALLPDPAVSSLGTGLKPVSVPPTPPPLAPAVITPPSPAAPRTSVPDFAKPLTDEKYFRQLNRF